MRPGGVATRRPRPTCCYLLVARSTPVKEIGGALSVTPDESPCWVRAALEDLVRLFENQIEGDV